MAVVPLDRTRDAAPGHGDGRKFGLLSLTGNTPLISLGSTGHMSETDGVRFTIGADASVLAEVMDPTCTFKRNGQVVFDVSPILPGDRLAMGDAEFLLWRGQELYCIAEQGRLPKNARLELLDVSISDLPVATPRSRRQFRVACGFLFTCLITAFAIGQLEPRSATEEEVAQVKPAAAAITAKPAPVVAPPKPTEIPVVIAAPAASPAVAEPMAKAASVLRKPVMAKGRLAMSRPQTLTPADEAKVRQAIARAALMGGYDPERARAELLSILKKVSSASLRLEAQREMQRLRK